MTYPSRHVFILVVTVAILSSVLLQAAGAESKPWRVHVGALVGFPASPAAFRDDAKPGFGVVAGARRVLIGRWSLGLEGEFAQFAPGDVEGSDLTGGTRRFGRVGVPLRVQAWEHAGMRRTRLDFELSAGYAHLTRQSISGTRLPPEPATRADGVAWTAGASLSSSIFDATRLFGALRTTGGIFPDESPAFVGLVLGIDAAPARP